MCVCINIHIIYTYSYHIYIFISYIHILLKNVPPSPMYHSCWGKISGAPHNCLVAGTLHSSSKHHGFHARVGQGRWLTILPDGIDKPWVFYDIL